MSKRTKRHMERADVQELERTGWEYLGMTKGHHRYRNPRNGATVTVSGSPRNAYQASRNGLSLVRRLNAQ